MIPNILEDLTDEELKREAKNESKNDVISTVIRSCRHLLSKLPNQEEKLKEFEMFRLKMLLRYLLHSSQSRTTAVSIFSTIFICSSDCYKYHHSMAR
jgi:hypothetical protein